MVLGNAEGSHRRMPWYAEGISVGVAAAQGAPGRATSSPMPRAMPSV
jgi:hypothetical protein